jgi:ABC-type amino acid transport substrate-binding protein
VNASIQTPVIETTAAQAGRLGRYQLQGVIGRGGMGEVHRAFDTRTNRVVALKVLPSHLAEDATYQQRFLRESRAVAGVNDPHVVPIHSFGAIDGRLYLDMRLIDGRNLGAMLEAGELFDPKFTVSLLEQVATALDAAHDANLIHRDVKPSNILITKRDFVYLIDFGLARSARDSGLTTAGNTLGTMAYMAPERFAGGVIDSRADVYSLACVLYECLTGELPFSADGLEQQIGAHISAPPPRPSALGGHLAAFDEVIAKGMAKSPAKRYRTAGQLAAAARKACETPVRHPRSGRHAAQKIRKAKPRSRLRPMLAATGGLVLVAGLSTFGVWQWWSSTSDARPVGVAERMVPMTTSPGAVPEIAAMVPDHIRSTGRLVVGVNSAPHAPMEFEDANGQIVGFDVDLMNAVARTLGLTADYRDAALANIIGSVQAGGVDIGMSSLADTAERELHVDFVTYLQPGTLWAQRPQSFLDPDAPCGLTVAVAAGTLQELDEIPRKSDECVAAGMAAIDLAVYDDQDEATAALEAGEVDAMSADSPVTGFAIKLSRGEIEAAGDVFGPTRYGWAVQKGATLSEPLRRALEHLIASGEYRTIATQWGVERAMIAEPTVNGAAT